MTQANESADQSEQLRDIKAITEIWATNPDRVKHVNEYLKKGWLLLKIRDDGQYILGHREVQPDPKW